MLDPNKHSKWWIMAFKLIEFRNSERPLWRLWWNGEGQSYADGDCPERKIGNAETPRWYDSRFSTPPPPPLSLFLAVDRPPWYKFISLPSLPLPLKSKMAVIIFVMKLLSTRSPKLGLLCRLKMEKKWLLPKLKIQIESRQRYEERYSRSKRSWNETLLPHHRRQANPC